MMVGRTSPSLLGYRKQIIFCVTVWTVTPRITTSLQALYRFVLSKYELERATGTQFVY